MSAMNSLGLTVDQLIRLRDRGAIPEYASNTKVAEWTTADRSRCADRAGEYPCHNRAATWASAVRVKLAGAADGQLDRAIDYYSTFWGISADVDAAVGVLTEKPIKTASATEPTYAVVWEDDGDVREALYMDGPEGCKAAADWLAAHRGELPLAERRVSAARILKYAKASGTELDGGASEFLLKTAGLGLADAGDVASQFRLRAAETLVPMTAYRLHKLATAVERGEVPLDLQDVRCKVAEAMDEADRSHRLLERNPALRPAEDVLFGWTEAKLAAAIDERITTTSGRHYRIDELSEIPIEKLAEYLGDELAGACRKPLGNLDAAKLAEILPTLPRPDAEMFDRMMGHEPKRAAARSQGLTVDQLKSIAAIA